MKKRVSAPLFAFVILIIASLACGTPSTPAPTPVPPPTQVPPTAVPPPRISLPKSSKGISATGPTLSPRMTRRLMTAARSPSPTTASWCSILPRTLTFMPSMTRSLTPTFSWMCAWTTGAPTTITSTWSAACRTRAGRRSRSPTTDCIGSTLSTAPRTAMPSLPTAAPTRSARARRPTSSP